MADFIANKNSLNDDTLVNLDLVTHVKYGKEQGLYFITFFFGEGYTTWSFWQKKDLEIVLRRIY